MSPNSPENRLPDWLKERGGTSVSSEPPFSNSRPGGAGETTEFLTAPHGAPESPPLSLRIGCALVFEAISETSFLLNVLPQIERTQVLVEERFMLGRGMSAETARPVAVDHGTPRSVSGRSSPDGPGPVPGRFIFTHAAVSREATRYLTVTRAGKGNPGKLDGGHVDFSV